MTEAPSQTANHQRLDEMLVHLTPLGARVPYSICIDNENNIWVAAKGGLFKVDRSGNVLFQEKNSSTKKTAPFCQVLHYHGKIIYAYAEDPSSLTLLKLMNLSGQTISEQFIDGKIQSLTVSDGGEIFLTKRLQGEDSIIYKTDINCPFPWEEVISEDDYAFQTLCSLSNDLLLASTCNIPINMYSKQRLRLIDVKKGTIVKTFGEKGKKDGQIFFPLSMQRYGEEILILDKTGRIQQFTRSGEFVCVATQIDAYLGNAFVIDGTTALVACSGIVLDRENRTVCDDWLERVPLDGTKWLPDPDCFEKRR